MPRRRDNCISCQEEREIVAHGVRANCYMARKRKAEDDDPPFHCRPDRSQLRYIAERHRHLKNMCRIVELVDETECLDRNDAQAIKGTLYPYMAERIAWMKPREMELQAETESKLTVNTDQTAGVNSAELTVAEEPVCVNSTPVAAKAARGGE